MDTSGDCVIPLEKRNASNDSAVELDKDGDYSDYLKAQKQQKWHFVTNKLVTISKTMRRIGNESSPLVIMDSCDVLY